jgi:tRNA threonylcarbamoyladenosine biosynthesis protein TsaB
MKILAVDTCLGACSAAVLSGGAVIAHSHVAMERGHAEALAPMVEAVMAEARLAFASLDRLGVTTGPGTFTGQRVGLAFMRGLRVGLRKPLAGVTSLAAMAAQAMDETKLAQAAVLHDARRDEVYIEIVGSHALPPAVMKFDEAAAIVGRLAQQGPLVVAGTAAKRAEDWCRAHGATVTVSNVVAPDSVWVARLCAQAPVGDAPPKPLYLRAPDAKLPEASR